MLVVQSHLTSWSRGLSPPASSAHGILQTSILKWVAIPFSRRSSNPEIKPWSIEPTLQAVWATRKAHEALSRFIYFFKEVRASFHFYQFKVMRNSMVLDTCAQEAGKDRCVFSQTTSLSPLSHSYNHHIVITLINYSWHLLSAYYDSGPVLKPASFV